MGAALDWLKKEYGFLVQEKETTVVTGVASVEAVPNDPDSFAIVMVNFGAQDIFLARAQNAPANSGIRLVANGGVTSMDLRDDFTMPTFQWFATSPGGASSLYVLRLRGEVFIG